jgi:hypothetical protein
MPSVAKRRLLLALCSALLLLPSSAVASQESASLIAKLSPDKLGADTTVTVGFRIGASSGDLPPPLVHVAIALPAGLGFASSTLGTATCDSSVLTARDVGKCPSNSVMGRGSDVIEVPLGPVAVRETARVTTFMGPSTGTHTNLLFYAEGRDPVIASLVFPGELLDDSGTGVFGTLLETSVPLISSTPGGPDASVVSFETTLGPKGLTYYRRVRGELVDYRPVGLAVPEVCPRGGFPFSARFAFLDGTEASATSTVRCPRSRTAGSRRFRGGRNRG